MAWLMMIARFSRGARIPQPGVPRVGRGDICVTAKRTSFRVATCKLSWPEHRAPGELLVSGSGLKCQRRRDKSVGQPSIVLAAPTQLPR